ncbi:RagB/SusD family nutrient uptake outer membrane protein [Pedobacter gandavensis]|uniref:RagB/SusD family nutrient uptake outer membrane protein n=1 Tax=Pedobacter gandavensis TaxID=2679963 RepID=UPI002931EEF3|nr:RagB/SusD family nutrient uptake outer membrane protein [Pedobacter gandavensis]
MKIFNRHKTINIALALVMILTMGSCKKSLFEEPFENLSPEQAFNSPERVEKAAIGMYDQLQNLDFFGGRILIYVDQRGADTNPATFFGDIALFTPVTANNTYAAGAYQGAYRTIGEVNLFLKNMEKAGSIVPANKVTQYTAEAKFIRSLCYFYLVNLYAQPYKFTAGATHLGVPLILKSADDPFSESTMIPRSTVAEVYNQIETDLKDAEVNLPVDYGDPALQNVARSTKGAAQALLARLYLYKGDFPNALTYSNKLIGVKYKLNTDPSTAFRIYNTNESIFSVAMNGGDNPNTNNALGQHYSPSKRGDITVAANYLALMDQTTDLRFKNLIILQGGSYWTTKFTNIVDWVPVFRYSEILLTKAEALANIATGVDPTALALVNEVRTRSLAAPIVATDKNDLIAKILVERRIELAFEGQGEFDFVRTGRNIPAHATVKEQAYGSDYIPFPIPFRETQINKNLIQNKGY